MASSEEKLEITVSQEDSRKRLDIYLADSLKDDYSRTQIQRLIKKGFILVNNKKVAPHYKTTEGDIIKLDVPVTKEKELKSESVKLNIVYEDNNLAIVNKPFGMVVHPGEDGQNYSGTLVNALLHHYGRENLSNLNGDLRPGIVHRLDKDTSGLLIIAKNNKTHKQLVEKLKGREIEKHYYALIKGKMEYETGSIDSPISRATHNRKMMAISKSQDKGRNALTHFKLINYFEYNDKKYSLIDVQIITGRTHQIRVHFKSIHHPVVGDTIYGNKKTNLEFAELNLKRQFLHAYRLNFTLGKKKYDIKIGLPKDLKGLIDNLNKV